MRDDVYFAQLFLNEKHGAYPSPLLRYSNYVLNFHSIKLAPRALDFSVQDTDSGNGASDQKHDCNCARCSLEKRATHPAMPPLCQIA